MKLFLLTILEGVKTVLAGGSGDSGCCKFTLSSSGPFSCPVGELLDGQLRLNGTYDTATFCIASDGGITDTNGFGCIVTESPISQIQCDLGKEPDKGFSINSDNVLLYHGSPKSSACPATDTEWNIYVAPNFSQAKCTPITLVADACGE
ncbi:uncharacterized protein LA080_009707 [Diaporthe eres]|nr:uncharacterized protein LA080_009707 [Diaporthe eres]